MNNYYCRTMVVNHESSIIFLIKPRRKARYTQILFVLLTDSNLVSVGKAGVWRWQYSHQWQSLGSGRDKGLARTLKFSSSCSDYENQLWWSVRRRSSLTCIGLNQSRINANTQQQSTCLVCIGLICSSLCVAYDKSRHTKKPLTGLLLYVFSHIHYCVHISVSNEQAITGFVDNCLIMAVKASTGRICPDCLVLPNCIYKQFMQIRRSSVRRL